MRRWRGSGPDDDAQPSFRGTARRAWAWLGLAGVYSLLIAALLCAPFELIDDLEQIRTRYEGFFCVPFAALSRGSHLNAVFDALKKVLFFAPLGALLALAVVPLSAPHSVRRILLAALLLAVAGIGVSIEMAQLFLLTHIPDVTDVILYTAGAAIGMVVTLRVIGPQAVRSFTRTG